MLSVIYSECHLCRVSFLLSVTCKPFMTSVILLNDIMLNVITLNVVMLSVVAPNKKASSVRFPDFKISVRNSFFNRMSVHSRTSACVLWTKKIKRSVNVCNHRLDTVVKAIDKCSSFF
jgi:hypothetical protein